MPIRPMVAATLLAAGSISAAPILPIGDLIRNPDAYANATVAVEGTVTTQAFGYRGEAVYTLQGSDDYRVTVFGRGGTPAAGTHLVVTGKVGRKPPDEEFDFPPIIVEATRQTP